MSTESILQTDKRIRLGIWGLGRGMSFYETCAALNFDVVAGCDFNQHMRDRFLEHNPGALSTADADEFLAADFDAVLLATFCPGHAEDAIRCLQAGKHVLSEVTAFHTLAQGVRLVEAVESSGLVYNLAENYPFTRANQYLAKKWQDGLFGDLMYAEYEYVHECRSLCYTYIDGKPVQPGYGVHSWRSWQNFHYYNTHSLGPVMQITGTRPTRVVSLPAGNTLAGYLVPAPHGMGGVSPSLMTMSNGALMRNLMGATTNDTHQQRLWGTLGSAELGESLYLRLGGSGHSRRLKVEPEWPMLGEVAESTGHGGGDFWVLYHFARQILSGEPAPFDVYTAADCTAPGLLAYRSSIENGQPYDVPDFRDPVQRDAVRDDTYAQQRLDTSDVFPEGADRTQTSRFTTVMKDLIRYATDHRSMLDWLSVSAETPDKAAILVQVDRFIEALPSAQQTVAAAQQLRDAYPDSKAAGAITEMLEMTNADALVRPDYLQGLQAARADLLAAIR